MKKFYAFLAAATVAMSASAVDLYLVGAMNSWTLEDEAYKMTEVSENVFVYETATLATNFKINDGTWGDDYNIGYQAGATMPINEEVAIVRGGGAQNINFVNNIQEVTNAKITLTLTEDGGTIIINGEAGQAAEIVWYLAGTLNDWAPWDSDVNKFEKYDENQYKQQVTFAEDYEFKVSTANWGENYGNGTLAMGQFATEPLEYNSFTNITCTLRGSWWMDWNYDTKVLSALSEEPVGGVSSIVADSNNAPAVYFNLQGQRVNNPANGLYIVKRGNQVVKTYIF